MGRLFLFQQNAVWLSVVNLILHVFFRVGGVLGQREVIRGLRIKRKDGRLEAVGQMCKIMYSKEAVLGKNENSYLLFTNRRMLRK